MNINNLKISINRAVDARVQKALQKSGRLVQRAAMDNLKGTNGTGWLRRSIKYDVDGDVCTIGAYTPYAP